MARKTSAVPAASPVVTPAALDLSYQYTSPKRNKEGEVLAVTVKAALAFLADMTPEEIICRYALREMALNKNAARVKTGAPASRIYQNTNLSPEVQAVLEAAKAAIVAAVPSMAPKAPAAPKAAPVPSLEDAVAQELAQPTPAAKPAGKRASDAHVKAAKAAKAVQAAPVEIKVIPEGVTRASARKAAKAAKAVQALAPAATPAQVQAVVQAATPAAQDAIISEAATGSGILTNDEVTAFLKVNPAAKLTDLRAAFPGRSLPALNRFVALKAAAKA